MNPAVQTLTTQAITFTADLVTVKDEAEFLALLRAFQKRMDVALKVVEARS